MEKIEITIEVMQKLLKELGHQDVLQGEEDDKGGKGCAPCIHGHP